MSAVRPCNHPLSLLVLAALALLIAPLMLAPAVATPSTATSATVQPRTDLLRGVMAWQLQLQGLRLDALARSPADMLVIDYERGPEDGGVFSAADIQNLRRRPGQPDRLVIAYLSIGEAEE